MQIIRTNDWKKYREGVIGVEESSFDHEIRYSEENDDFESFSNKKCINYVACEKNKVIGYLMSSPIEHHRSYNRKKHFGRNDTVLLESIAIDPKQRGKGIGDLLFQEFIKDCRKVKKKYIVLDATSEGMRGLALKHGFVKLQIYTNWNGNRLSWFMEKKL